MTRARVAAVVVGVGIAGCASAPAPWAVPAGYKSEVIAFPLEFAPTISHRGVEELRFAPGFFDPAAPGYWSYAFVWRTDDAAQLDAPALAAELTLYFRGLVGAVDDKHRISDADRATIAVTAAPDFSLTAHLFDAFGSALPIELTGHAARRACGDGALWIVVMSPAGSPRRAELEALAATAACGQPPAANKS